MNFLSILSTMKSYFYLIQLFIVFIVKEQRFSFILVAKPNDHKVMMKHLHGLKELRGLSQLTFTDEKGRQHLYEWENDVALNGNKNSIKVNFFEYSIIVNGKVTFHYGWVTDIPIDRTNIRHFHVI